MTDRLTTFDDLTVGQKACLEKTVTQADLDHFIAITGDTNPLHVDPDFAGRTFFGQCIAHGMLSASLFSTLVGMHIPGTGAIYKSQTLAFIRPVFINDTLTAWFEITNIDRAGETITLNSWIENQAGLTVIKGTATTGLIRS